MRAGTHGRRQVHQLLTAGTSANKAAAAALSASSILRWRCARRGARLPATPPPPASRSPGRRALRRELAQHSICGGVQVAQLLRQLLTQEVE